MEGAPTRWKYLFKTTVARFLMVPIWRDGDYTKDPEYISFGNAGSGKDPKDPRKSFGYYGTNDDQEAKAMLDFMNRELKRTGKKSFFPVKKQKQQVEVEVEVGAEEDAAPVEKPEVLEVCPECGKEYTGPTAKANLKKHMELKHN